MTETLKDEKRAELLRRIKTAIHETAEKAEWDWEDLEDGNSVLLTWEDEAYEMDATRGIPELWGELDDFYESYDPDYETYLWIGEDGHGKNGAPYHIKDILEAKERIDGAYERLRDEFGSLNWREGCDLDPESQDDDEEGDDEDGE